MKKAKRIELKTVKREKKLTEEEGEARRRRTEEGKTNTAALGTKEKGVKKRRLRLRLSIQEAKSSFTSLCNFRYLTKKTTLLRINNLQPVRDDVRD